MKRFWQKAGIAAQQDSWAVLLDGKPLRLPDGTMLQAGSQALAQGLAAEWDEIPPGAVVTPAALPLTGLAGALPRIAADPAASRMALLRFGESDLLCYRAERGPLAQRQQADWQPWLDWAARDLGATLQVAAGLAYIVQPPAALLALQQVLERQDEHALAALGVMVPAFGSLVLGLAVTAGMLEPLAAFRLSVLEELAQEQDWGADTDSIDRRARLAEDVVAAMRFLCLAREENETCVRNAF